MAQSKHLATASDSVDLQPVQRTPLPPAPPNRQRGHGASPGFALSKQISQVSTSQIAESLAGGELPLTVSGESEAREPREFARDSNDGVGEAIFSQPASLKISPKYRAPFEKSQETKIQKDYSKDVSLYAGNS